MVLMDHSGSSGVLCVPEYSHHIIRDRYLSAGLPDTVLSFPLPEVCQVHPGLHLQMFWVVVSVTVKKYYPDIKLQDGADVI